MTEAEKERAAVVAFLNGRPFPWARRMRLVHRIRAAMFILWHGEDVVFGLFKILALKISRGDHVPERNQ